MKKKYSLAVMMFVNIESIWTLLYNFCFKYLLYMAVSLTIIFSWQATIGFMKTNVSIRMIVVTYLTTIIEKLTDSIDRGLM